MQIRKYKLSLYKNRKRGIAEIWYELIGVVIFVVIGYAIYKVTAGLIGGFISGKDYDSTIKSFELLGKRIDNLIKDKNYANTNLLYFLDDNYILVGFNYKDPSIQIESCKKGVIFKESESLIEARKKMGSLCSGACLCIYKDTAGNDFDKNLQVPLQCKSFDKNVVFLAPSEQKYIFCSMDTGWNPKAYPGYYQAGGGYKFLILYGFNTKEVYLDKYESQDGNIFIFLGEYKDNPNEPIYNRKKFMEENYEK